MRHLAAALLLLAGSAYGTGPAPLDTSAVHVHDFATLTHAEVLRLDSRPALFFVSLDPDSDAEERDGFTCADCVGEGEPLRSLYLLAGQELPDGPAGTMTVRATLGIRHYPALVGADGSRMGPLREYRLVGAVRVGF